MIGEAANFRKPEPIAIKRHDRVELRGLAGDAYLHRSNLNQTVTVNPLYGGCGPIGLLTLGTWLTVSLGLIVVLALTPQARHLIDVGSKWVDRYQHVVPIAVLAVSVIAAVGEGGVATQRPGFTYPSWLVAVFESGLTAFLALLAPHAHRRLCLPGREGNVEEAQEVQGTTPAARR